MRRLPQLFVLALACAATSCGGSASRPVAPVPPAAPATQLTAVDVQTIVSASASVVDSAYVVAVVDRGGNILGVYEKPGAPATSTGNFGQTVSTRELAVGLARTGAFFSNDQAPLSSRTIRFISGIHFPPGISFTPNAALYGIENTNRGCPLNLAFAPGKAVDPARSISGSALGTGVITGKADVFDSNASAVNPGGVPLFRNGQVVGGVGVAGVLPDTAEFAAFSGAAAGFLPSPAAPGVVVVDGVSLPFVDQTSRPAGESAGTANGTFVIGPSASPGPVPDGDLVVPRAGPLGGLSAAEVRQIIDHAVQTAAQTRAVIRLPIGSRTRMVMAVADLDGSIIALHRMPDATVFSIDVAVAKARNMIYFNSSQVSANDLPGVPLGTAVTNRTISFGAQPFYPPGIDGAAAGPFFDLYRFDTLNPCTQGADPVSANQSGIVFFPGSLPLYRNGILVGGLGVSGDGVEQDDFVSAGGAAGFEAPVAKRADQIMLRDVRLPYLKFPRNPTD